jgi:hypothetical protein
MINLFICAKTFPVTRTLAVLALLACFSIPARGANRIAGVVRNQTLGQPSAGDAVLLLRLDQKMPEESRSKTDAQGTFAFDVQNSGQPYLVRVLHKGVNYDQQVSTAQTLSIDVFDSAPQVRGITGSIEIFRTGTNGKFLHVSDMIEVRNDSNPPMTQTGARTFEVYLPTSAKIDSVLAAGPGKIGEQIAAVPVRGEPGHFAVNFPLRPGATKFAFNYDVPYDGHAKFQPRLAYPLQQLAVMIPPTMKFSSDSPSFAVLPAGNSRYQVQAANKLAAGEGPAFEISGAGALPPIAEQAKSQPTLLPSQTVPPTADSAPTRNATRAPAVASPVQTQSTSQLLFLGVLTALLLAACILLVSRATKTRRLPGAEPPVPRARLAQPSAILLQGLEKELSQLESDKQRGLISGREYASTKQALDETLKRKLADVN